MKWLALLGLLAQGDVQEEYRGKLAKVCKTASLRHYSVGDFLSGTRMYRWAREQFFRTLEYDPDHTGARRKLGYKKGEDGWEIDPSVKLEINNLKKGEDADRVRKLYNNQLESLGKDLSRSFAELGQWCRKNGLEAESAAAHKKTLEYNPSHSGARKELEFEKDVRGGWVSKWERELRREMREGLEKAPQGEPSEEETEVEEALEQSHKKMQSGHFLIESPHLTREQHRSLVQHAEHAYEMYRKLLDLPDIFEERRMTFTILQDKAQHVKYVDAFVEAEGALKDLARKSRGQIGFPRSETYAAAGDAWLGDYVVHVTAQVLSQACVGGEHHWIHEGMAYFFTRQIKGTAQTFCVDLAGTGTGKTEKNYRDPENWRIVCKVWVREGKDPEINAILKCTNLAELDGAETVKAWSLVDFLLCEHREKFLDLFRRLQTGSSIDEGLRASFGWTAEDLDVRWRSYVRYAY